MSDTHIINQNRTDTPTRYDLARWMFLAIEERTSRCTTREDCLTLIYEISAAIVGPQPEPEPRPSRKSTA